MSGKQVKRLIPHGVARFLSDILSLAASIASLMHFCPMRDMELGLKVLGVSNPLCEAVKSG